ncbi:hypothetical protein KKB10_00145 [Patescibacteria group bacterium]|nr:hypothetical protein [Patescibacteria group bacterium]MBU1074789.1 hypothetical protein [Patescibacteria group bacterium]MBU1951792.1 hypothetical protein [Patescibacteria group bacterium]
METFQIIIGYVIMIFGLFLIRSQGAEYSRKKGLGILLTLIGAVLLFFIGWWHVIIAFVVSGVINAILGKKSGIEKEVEKESKDSDTIE